jgi:two-component system, OmpR family, sensor histidine kinase KdpD
MKLPSVSSQRVGYSIAVILVIAATLLFLPGRPHFDEIQWALLYLLIIVFVASLSGFKAALVATVLSFFMWNYFFLPPYGSMIVKEPRDWISLVVFLMVGILMSLQAAKLRERETQALERERDTTLINRFSAHIISEISVQDMAMKLLNEVMDMTGASHVGLYLSEDGVKIQSSFFIPESAETSHNSIEGVIDLVFNTGKARGLPAQDPSGWRNRRMLDPVNTTEEDAAERKKDLILPLRTDTMQAGVLFIGGRKGQKPYSWDEARLLIVLSNQAAVFLERKRLQSIAVQADALKEADRLKSTFISSISHELKTPLSSITATVTNLLEADMEWNAANARQELIAIKEDLNRLNTSIGSLVDLSRLESAAWEPRKELYEFGEILGTAISRIPQRSKGRVAFQVNSDLPPINVDFAQWARVLQNLIENALIYSGDSSPVRVGASSDNDMVTMWVEDEGPGIPAKERELIFEKFFRGSSSSGTVSGTGLGLAITREIVRYHGGTIEVKDVKPRGIRFEILLPMKE